VIAQAILPPSTRHSPFLPFALAITVGTVAARRLLATCLRAASPPPDS
jgi:hypothetical protein